MQKMLHNVAELFQVPSLQIVSWAERLAIRQPGSGIVGLHQAVQRMHRGALMLRCRSRGAFALTRQGCGRQSSSSGLAASVYDMCLVIILTDFLGSGR